jgi:hypothetical protein
VGQSVCPQCGNSEQIRTVRELFDILNGAYEQQSQRASQFGQPGFGPGQAADDDGYDHYNVEGPDAGRGTGGWSGRRSSSGSSQRPTRRRSSPATRSCAAACGTTCCSWTAGTVPCRSGTSRCPSRWTRRTPWWRDSARCPRAEAAAAAWGDELARDPSLHGSPARPTRRTSRRARYQSRQ